MEVSGQLHAPDTSTPG